MAKEIDSVEFTKTELSFLKEQRLSRIATVSSHGQPPQYRWHSNLMASASALEDGNSSVLYHSLKFKNILQNKVGFVVDDLISANPWTPAMTTKTNINAITTTIFNFSDLGACHYPYFFFT
jgi:hypothetical protein